MQDRILITGEIQNEAYILVVDGKYLRDMNLTPEKPMRAVFTKLRSQAKLYGDLSLARITASFIADTKQAVGAVEIDSVNIGDRHLGSAIARARVLPDIESIRRKNENIRFGLRPAIRAIVLLFGCLLGTAVFAQQPAGAGTEHHNRMHRPHVHHPKLHLHKPHRLHLRHA